MAYGYGDVEPVVTFLEEKGLTVEGVFLTYAHFDYIYGLLELVKRYPQCKVYVTEYAKEGMAFDKLNILICHDPPNTNEGDNEVVVHEGDSLRLFAGE